ncbi:MAG: outer membrane beta-barrel protein [bacterium]
MKRYIGLMVLLMVLASTPGASASEDRLPAKGTKQLIFGFSGWRLDQYKGGIGLRYYLRENTALRFGLDVTWSKDDDTGWDHAVYETQETRQRTYTAEQSAFSVGLGTMLERHFGSSWKVVPFAGLGVFGWYDKSNRDSRTVSTRGTDVSTSNEVRESKGYTIEGILLAGLQWHFAPNMSLGGEYRIKLRYYYVEIDRDYTDWDSQSTDYDAYKDYDLTLDSSQLWLAISF